MTCKNTNPQLNLRNIVLIIALGLLGYSGFSQHLVYQMMDSSSTQQDTNFYFETAFQELDTSSMLETNYLWDRTWPNIPLEHFSGVVEQDSVSGSQKLMQSYLDLRYAAIHSDSLPDYDSLVSLFDQLSMGYDAIPLTILDFKVDHIRSDALEQGDLSLQDSVLHITGPQSPFETMDVFMAGILSDALSFGDSFRIVAPDITFWGNRNVSPETLRINFNDGQGWHTLGWNEPFDYYLNGEAGSIEVNIEISYANGETRQSKQRIYKANSACTNFPIPEEAPWGGEVLSFEVPTVNSTTTINRKIDYHLTSSEGFNGKKGRGKVYVKYRNSLQTNEPKTFEKPVVFVEGIDFGASLPSFVPSPRTGSYISRNSDLAKFSNTIKLGNFGWPELFGCDLEDDYPNEKLPDLMTKLTQNDNDIIMLDFVDGADYIQRNGLVLKELINRINQHKIGQEEIVIIAVSMGGQVARWTLSNMEANDQDHCVRLFASHDSPWNGAFIPPAVQFTIQYNADLYGDAAAIKGMRNLNRPATKQLLLYHYSVKGNATSSTNNNIRRYHYYLQGDGRHDLRKSFVQEMSALGDYPRECRNVAVANGNAEGDSKFGDGVTYFNMSSSCFGYDIKFRLFSLNKWNNLVSRINRPFSYERRHYIYGLPSLGGVPGGSRVGDIKDIRDGLVDGFKNDWLVSTLCPSVTIPQEGPQKEFTFVPTTSALAINGLNLDSKVEDYVDRDAAKSSGYTHFEAYFDSEDNGDEEHGEVTDENIDWIMRQVKYGENTLQIETAGVLTKSWNNPTENSHIEGLDIDNGGILQLNAYDRIYDGQTSEKTVEGSLSHVRIGGVCSSSKTVNVNDGGKLILGDNNLKNNRAYLYLKEGATLNVNSGGDVKIEKRSKIIIQDGGEMIIDNSSQVVQLEGSEIVVQAGGKLSLGGALDIKATGATIVNEGGEIGFVQNSNLNLVSVDARLLIKGKLTLGPNAVLDFSGDGRLVFDQDPWVNGNLDLSRAFDLAPSSEVNIQGTASNPKTVEIKKPLYFKDGQGDLPQAIQLINTDLVMHNQAFIFLAQNFLVEYCHIQAADPQQSPGYDGFRVFGNPGNPNMIRNCQFDPGNEAVFAQWVGNFNPLRLHDNSFNQVRLELQSGRFELERNQFANSQVTGDALQGYSDFSYNTFQETPVDLYASNQTSVGITANDFLGVGNMTWGLTLNQVNAELECNQFKNLAQGVTLEEGTAFLVPVHTVECLA